MSFWSQMSSHERLLSGRVTRSDFLERTAPAAGMRTGCSGQAREQRDQLGPSGGEGGLHQGVWEGGAAVGFQEHFQDPAVIIWWGGRGGCERKEGRMIPRLRARATRRMGLPFLTQEKLDGQAGAEAGDCREFVSG